MDAAETCGVPCSSGSSDECEEGEFCFAYTGCESDLFFCGESYEDASESCLSGTPTPCSSKSSGQCPDGSYCYAFVSACKDVVEDISLGAFGNFGGFTGSDAPQKEVPNWASGFWETKPVSSSSMTTTTISLFITCMLAALYVSL
jgi:hypothetical protein